MPAEVPSPSSHSYCPAQYTIICIIGIDITGEDHISLNIRVGVDFYREDFWQGVGDFNTGFECVSIIEAIVGSDVTADLIANRKWCRQNIGAHFCLQIAIDVPLV